MAAPVGPKKVHPYTLEFKIQAMKLPAGWKALGRVRGQEFPDRDQPAPETALAARAPLAGSFSSRRALPS
jgi:hypothetical protein